MTSPIKQKKIVLASPEGDYRQSALIGVMHTILTVVIALTATYISHS
jgi:hypothetical protein